MREILFAYYCFTSKDFFNISLLNKYYFKCIRVQTNLLKQTEFVVKDHILFIKHINNLKYIKNLSLINIKMKKCDLYRCLCQLDLYRVKTMNLRYSKHKCDIKHKFNILDKFQSIDVVIHGINNLIINKEGPVKVWRIKDDIVKKIKILLSDCYIDSFENRLQIILNKTNLLCSTYFYNKKDFEIKIQKIYKKKIYVNPLSVISEDDSDTYNNYYNDSRNDFIRKFQWIIANSSDINEGSIRDRFKFSWIIKNSSDIIEQVIVDECIVKGCFAIALYRKECDLFYCDRDYKKK